MAKQWRAAAAQSLESGAAVGPELGRITYTSDAAQVRDVAAVQNTLYPI